MATERTATVVNGMLKVDGPLDYPEQWRVRLVLEPLDWDPVKSRETIERPESKAGKRPRNSGGLRFTNEELHEQNCMNAINRNILICTVDDYELVEQRRVVAPVPASGALYRRGLSRTLSKALRTSCRSVRLRIGTNRSCPNTRSSIHVTATHAGTACCWLAAPLLASTSCIPRTCSTAQVAVL